MAIRKIDIRLRLFDETVDDTDVAGRNRISLGQTAPY
jgi:hypothetical protein